MQDLGYELPRIPIPRTWVNKPLYKRRRGALNGRPFFSNGGLGPPAKPAWGSFIDPPRAYLLTGCGPPFSMPLACCRRDSLSRRPRGVTVYPGADAAIHEKLQFAWLPRLQVIGAKVRCWVSASCQQCSLTKRRVVLRSDKQPRVHVRVRARASARAGINHVADVVIHRVLLRISRINVPVSTLREADVRGYIRMEPFRVAVVGALGHHAVVALAVGVGAVPFDARLAGVGITDDHLEPFREGLYDVGVDARCARAIVGV
jgi:hypothetical protein